MGTFREVTEFDRWIDRRFVFGVAEAARRQRRAW
jgi:hypothetical protein